ncbi:molybdopterin cofactor-binding domain-containing protein [uncultured Dysosmobacter sp.]|uniref:molybdopterin-dependent oxidoreductase n=1 Tax=uncultured Dysosmobacter sp. TaxID=2591384 RepID=UPI002630BC18|nr:molybdopterin cofactor-binding domain-containing protein [uncultured Dysosmobacter sp.]
MGQVTFILNGRETTAVYADRQTLLKYLRNVECLKGSKEACGTGHCGACSVIIDGKLARSCVTMMKTLAGKQVETIEHAAQDGELSVIQRSFLDAGAVQCGFCTPGMVMAAKVLLSKTLEPTEDEIYEGLKHNYCRCTGYVKIIEAVKLAAARLRGEAAGIDDFRSHEKTSIVIGKDQVVPPIKGTAVGKPAWDVDGFEKVTGALKFCDDYDASEFGEDEMLHGAFVWAPVPHARISRVDYSDAEKAAGVVRVITYQDVPGLNKIGTWTPEQPVFCADEVRFLGDYIALVVADTEAHARAAAKLAKIHYEVLPGLYSMAEGVKAGSYIVQTRRESGDVDAAKQNPDLVRVRVSKEIQPQEHACMEPVSAIGYGHGGRVTVYSCTQAPFEVRAMLAKNLDMPEERIRVVATPLGGGFGKKCDSFLEAPAAVAGYVCQKPVKVTLTRQEDLIVTTKRHGYHTDYEIGFTKDGKFQYLDSHMFSDGGPYQCESYGTLMTGCLMSGGPYIIENVRVDARCIRNNSLQGGAFRGYGINQAAISIETAMDMMAEKLHIDPFELRRWNAVYPGSYSVGGELLESSMGMHDTIDQCEKRLKEALREYEGLYPNGTKVLGWGMASGFKNSGVGKGIFIDDGACKLTMMEDGRLQMIVSGTDMGQGFRTAMVQIAAETLDMDMKDIDIIVGDTDITIPTGESVSERQTLCDGRAVYEACVKLREELAADPWKPGETRRAEYYFQAPECFAVGDFEGAEAKGLRYRNFPAYAYATQAAIVEVDKATGKVRVLKIIAAHDVGRAINPRIIEGQMEGSCSMGQGYALTEGYPAKDGYPVKRFYKDLGLPKAEDTPDYELILIEDPEPIGPYGAKGISEVATVPVTPAILNAIYNAIGVRIDRVPASPEVILEAIRTGRCDVPTMAEMVERLNG